MINWIRSIPLCYSVDSRRNMNVCPRFHGNLSYCMLETLKSNHRFQGHAGTRRKVTKDTKKRQSIQCGWFSIWIDDCMKKHLYIQLQWSGPNRRADLPTSITIPKATLLVWLNTAMKFNLFHTAKMEKLWISMWSSSQLMPGVYDLHYAPQSGLHHLKSVGAIWTMCDDSVCDLIEFNMYINGTSSLPQCTWTFFFFFYKHPLSCFTVRKSQREILSKSSCVFSGVIVEIMFKIWVCLFLHTLVISRPHTMTSVCFHHRVIWAKTGWKVKWERRYVNSTLPVILFVYVLELPQRNSRVSGCGWKT